MATTRDKGDRAVSGPGGAGHRRHLPASLLRMGLGSRLAIAAAVAAGLWLAMLWALW